MKSFEDNLISLLESNDFQSASTLSTKKVEEIHSIAFYLYQDQQYDKAARFFRLLTAINPLETRYWKGLGASLQLNQRYLEAIESYRQAVLLCPTKPDPYLFVYAADCYFALNQPKQGLKALEGAQLSAQEQKNKQVIDHVSLMRRLWSKK